MLRLAAPSVVGRHARSAHERLPRCPASLIRRCGVAAARRPCFPIAAAASRGPERRPQRMLLLLRTGRTRRSSSSANSGAGANDGGRDGGGSDPAPTSSPATSDGATRKEAARQDLRARLLHDQLQKLRQQELQLLEQQQQQQQQPQQQQQQPSAPPTQVPTAPTAPTGPEQPPLPLPLPPLPSAKPIPLASVDKPTIFYTNKSLLPEAERLLRVMSRTELGVYTTAAASMGTCFTLLYDVPMSFVMFGGLTALMSFYNGRKVGEGRREKERSDTKRGAAVRRGACRWVRGGVAGPTRILLHPSLPPSSSINQSGHPQAQPSVHGRFGNSN
jgi:hypothetical protein